MQLYSYIALAILSVVALPLSVAVVSRSCCCTLTIFIAEQSDSLTTLDKILLISQALLIVKFVATAERQIQMRLQLQLST